MLAPHLKRKVDDLWNKFWTAGITNPLVAIEQITYLLFLKRLEGVDAARVREGKASIYDPRFFKKANECTWSYISQERNDVEHLRDVVFPWLRALEKTIASADAWDRSIGAGTRQRASQVAIGNRMSDAYFQLDPNKGAILSEAIGIIDDIFGHIDTATISDDIMGDAFEYLLSEIASAGKNGQFRTPRHLIRVMADLLDPQPGMRIIDPAAGTGGFLFSAIGHLLQRHTDTEKLLLEWDGTPHRADGSGLIDIYDQVFNGLNYVGFDNDRTMVRIGWMNMILHGIENPQIHQRDSLARRKQEEGDESILRLLASETYDRVLANPPFTGTVDTADLEVSLFPRAAERGKKAELAITNKSELLFVWLMLDLLKVGGRCAVIVPEGVLFGGTDAHQALRRELLTEHLVEGIISLPGGAFQPYTGVKTAILIFQKETAKAQARASWKQRSSQPPRTQSVWFYEVQDECYTPDAKRQERKGQDNDLWDAVAKFKRRQDYQADALAYYQPQYRTERWRLVDDATLATFSDNQEVSNWKDQVASIKELFGLSADPVEAQREVEAAQAEPTQALISHLLLGSIQGVSAQLTAIESEADRDRFISSEMKKARTAFNRTCITGVKDLFDREEPLGWTIYQTAIKAEYDRQAGRIESELLRGQEIPSTDWKEQRFISESKIIATAYAKLDGYDVMLRTTDVMRRDAALTEAKNWTAPVRRYAVVEDWQDTSGTLRGSHDEQGEVRPEYVASVSLYNDKGDLDAGLLEPDCIEARGWNLSAGQYKPFSFTSNKNKESVADMIRDLKRQEQAIAEELDELLAMVEGA